MKVCGGRWGRWGAGGGMGWGGGVWWVGGSEGRREGGGGRPTRTDLDLDSVADLDAHRTPPGGGGGGGHDGVPDGSAHRPAMPRETHSLALDGPPRHAASGAVEPAAAQGHAPLDSRGAPGPAPHPRPCTLSGGCPRPAPPVWVTVSRHNRVHGRTAPCPNVPLGWPFPSRASGGSVSWAPAQGSFKRGGSPPPPEWC